MRRSPCARRRRRQQGSISLVLAAVLAFGALAAAATADVSRVVAARASLQAVADAAALAAAQELVLPSGRTPAEVAAEYAELGGARVVACRCAPGGSDVLVTVEDEVLLPFLRRTSVVRGSARAVVLAPAGSEGLQSWFAARLGCLLARAPGIEIVSGFRTRAEQARLHREKPHLAAPPGRSLHERGLAADLSFPSADVREAAHREAEGCGLVFPLPHEPWHAEPAE